MDAIFRGILLSNYNSDFKELLLRESVLKAAVKPETPPYACHEIFRIIFDVVGKCRIESDVKLAHQVFYSWVEHHSDHLREFLTDEIRASYLTDDTYQNKLEVLMLMFETLQRTMNDPVKASAIVQTHAIDLLRRDDMLNIAVPLTGVWENITLSSVSANCTVTLTKAMIRCLGRCHWPVNQRTLFSFVRDVQRVSNFIGMQWNKMSEADVKMCLMEVYAILSSDDGSNKFVCLAFLSPFVKTSFLEEMTKLMILDSRSSSSTLQRVFERVTDWLRWPAKNVDRVIISIMKILESAKHYSVLVQVTKAKIEQIFSYLSNIVLREATLPVILYMLLSYQHSPDVFHKVVIHIPELIKKLTEENTETSKNILKHIVEVVHLLMQFHSGFPELYDPIFQAIENFPPPDIMTMKLFMGQRKWGSNKRNYASSTLSFQRSETGKTGLVNLGNTCYMNTVLQALFMNDEFRTSILKSPPCAHQSLLLKLQEVFVFLLYTKRAAYSPKSFSEASRPSWFQAGQQQDCSEFLRFLFDSMHEQECHQEFGNIPSDNDKRVDIEANSETCAVFSKTQKPFQCLIHRLFGGELTVSYKCLHCHQVSTQKENFIDLSLALPEGHNDAKYVQRKELKAGRAEGNLGTTGLDCDSFPDLESSDQVSDVPAALEDDLKLEDLIHHYISPEKLEGENRYHCSNCNTLREAQKSIGISVAPKYLTLTLLRFAYDIHSHQRVKILRNVVYPEVLSIPADPLANECSDSTSGKLKHTYVLHAVVVHSGVSSDCGHYYVYARHSDAALHSTFSHGSGNRSWNLFNDSRVSFSKYETLAKLSQRFAHDTAYLLFYCRETPEAVVSDSDTNRIKDTDIRSDILEAVCKDNLAYVQELEEDEAKQEKIATTTAKFNSHWKDFDDHQPPGNCGNGSGGFGSFSATFVC